MMLFLADPVFGSPLLWHCLVHGAMVLCTKNSIIDHSHRSCSEKLFALHNLIRKIDHSSWNLSSVSRHKVISPCLFSSLSTMSIMDRQLSRQMLSNKLSNENINTGVFVVFKTKREMPKQTIFLEPPVFFCFHY